MSCSEARTGTEDALVPAYVTKQLEGLERKRCFRRCRRLCSSRLSCSDHAQICRALRAASRLARGYPMGGMGRLAGS